MTGNHAQAFGKEGDKGDTRDGEALPGGRRPLVPGSRAYYEVRVKGHLDAGWSDWLGGLAVTNSESGEAVLAGWLADQATLHGLLARIRDLNLMLISVNRVESRGEDEPHIPPVRG